MYSIWLSTLTFTLARHAAQVEETSTFPIWITIPLLLTLIALFIYSSLSYRRASLVVIGEMEVGTVFSRRTGNFLRFLRPGFHRIDPYREREGDRIYLGSQSASGTCDELRTKEGIPLSIEYNVSFSVDPDDVLPAIRYKMARALPKAAPNMIAGRVKHILRHLVEQKSIYELYQAGALKKLEAEVRAEVSSSSKAIGVGELGGSDVKLGPIRMPAQLEKALKMDYERKLQTATSIEALERLHAVVSKFEERDMERLWELEQLRVLEKSGSPVYMMDALVKRVRETAVTSGSSSQN